MRKVVSEFVLLLLAMCTLTSCAQTGVTASRDYVNRRTTLAPVTNNGVVVGFKLGINTNDSEILAAQSYVGNPVPGGYEAVSNAAMNARSKTDMNAYSTNGVPTGDMLATTGDVEVAMGRIKTDRITDGTNTIDAAGCVWEVEQAYSDWTIVYVSPDFSYWGIHIEESGQGDGAYWVPYSGDAVAGIAKGYADSTNLVWAGEGVVDFSATRSAEWRTNLVGRVAYTNDIPTVDYTTANTQLVATIEATAPAPSNYAAVSNAAMNARSETDLDVRGAPDSEGSFFDVDGYRYSFQPSTGKWVFSSDSWIEEYDDGYRIYGISIYSDKFVLDATYSATVDFMGESLVIIGYTNKLAQVSQIPAVPQGIVTTNANGEMAISGDRLTIYNAGRVDNTTVMVGASTAVDITNTLEVTASYNGGVVHVNSTGAVGGDGIRIVGAGSNVGGEPYSDPMITVNGTNIIPFVFGAAQRTEISATNETFSNAVLSVGLNIDTNAVAAINAFVEQGSELPVGGATTVGALLLALAAAVAALKRGKADASDLRYSFATAEQNGYVYSDWTVSTTAAGVTDIEQPYFDEPTTNWYCNLKYNGLDLTLATGGSGNELSLSMTDDHEPVTITATRTRSPKYALRDRAINSLSLSADGTLAMPEAPSDGKAQDFVVRLTLSGTPVASPAFGDSADYETEGGANLDFTAAGTYIVRFTETLRAQDAEWVVDDSALPSGWSAIGTPVYSDGAGAWSLSVSDGSNTTYADFIGNESETSLSFEFEISNTAYTVTATRKPVFLVQSSKVAEIGSAT